MSGAPVDSQPRDTDSEERPSSSDNTDGGYPPQKHAGAVGYGPEYGKHPTVGEKFEGRKDKLMGKITHNPDRVVHGDDLMTGELRKKEMDDNNPFEGSKPNSSPSKGVTQAATTAAEGSDKAERQKDGHNADRVKNIG